MGAWGTRIYEDDSALDLRGDFLEQLRAGTAVSEIEAALRQEYFNDNTPQGVDIAKLALACVELETATLTDSTKRAALEVIESGRDYQVWLEEADKTDAGLRSRELKLVQKYLENYDGTPVKRRSWVELQRGDRARATSGEFEAGEKLDDVDWHSGSVKGGTAQEREERAGVHIAAVVYWLVTRKYLLPPEPELLKAAPLISSGKMRVTQFLVDGLDGKLFAGEVKPAVRAFVTAYYQGGRQYYLDDFVEVMVAGRPEYSFVPTLEEYKTLAARIDERFADWQANPYDSDIAPRKRTGIPRQFWARLIGFGIAMAVIYWLSRQ